MLLLPSFLFPWPPPPPPPLPPPPPSPSPQTGVVAVSLPPAMAHYRRHCAARFRERCYFERGDLILIHANDHALWSPSPPSPPPPPPLAPPPVPLYLTRRYQSRLRRRHQVSPQLTAGLFCVASRVAVPLCRWRLIVSCSLPAAWLSRHGTTTHMAGHEAHVLVWCS